MIDMECGTCRYYDKRSQPGYTNIGKCAYFDGSDELIKFPQWVRKADRTVWGDQDGNECSRWDKA